MKILQQKHSYCGMQNQIVTIKNMGNWNHLKIIQKIAEQQTGKARHQGNTANSHIQDCPYTSESTNVKVHTFSTGNSITSTHYTL